MTDSHSIPNTMVICGQPALITWIPEISLFRGKFLGLSGYCDFVSDSAKGLAQEGEISLNEYIADCKASGIEPYEREEKTKTFTLRYPESFGERLATAAAERRMSVNSYIVEILSKQMKLK
jgi:predicted HicB family RNase H-like nuclease